MNVLSIDEKTAVVEAGEIQLADFIKAPDLEPNLCPFQHVNNIGGPFHCATVDFIRQNREATRL